jgi:hypothetical protein
MFMLSCGIAGSVPFRMGCSSIQANTSCMFYTCEHSQLKSFEASIVERLIRNHESCMVVQDQLMMGKARGKRALVQGKSGS